EHLVNFDNNFTHKDTSYEEISREDSFDSLADNNKSNYQLENEYEMMQEYLNNREFDKVRELEKKIVQKEISTRKVENKRRLERLKNLEEKLMSDVRRVTNEKTNANNTPHLNLPKIGYDDVK